MADNESNLSRRELLGRVGKAAAAAVVALPVLQTTIFSDANAATTRGAPRRLGAVPVNGVAGIDRVVVLPGKTYLRGWAGYGEPPRQGPRRRGAEVDSAPPPPTGPAPTVRWSKVSVAGKVTFADPKALVTTATFSVPGAYVVQLTADNGESKASS